MSVSEIPVGETEVRDVPEVDRWSNPPTRTVPLPRVRYPDLHSILICVPTAVLLLSFNFLIKGWLPIE